jgi:hypothetical protein
MVALNLAVLRHLKWAYATPTRRFPQRKIGQLADETSRAIEKP